MTDQFVAEIRIFPFNFPPTGWAFCDGQILSISQNTALFSLLGTTYGGNGTSNFALPNLQGNVAMHIGGNQPGPGLSLHVLGETGGSDTVTLLQSEMPSHAHNLTIDDDDPTSKDPTNRFIANSAVNVFSTAGVNTQMSQASTSQAGGNQPHNNLQPYLTLNFCIALQGIFPPRT